MGKDNGNKAKAALLTLRDVENEFGLPYTSARDLVIKGLLPRVDLHTHRIWVKRADIEALIEQGTTRGGLA